VSAFAVWYWAFHEPEPKDDFGRFQGEWKLVVSGRDGSPEDDRTPYLPVRITGDQWKYLGANERTYRMTLNEAASPKEIELTLLDQVGNPVGAYGSHGIYTVERKTARIRVEPVSKPRPDRIDDPDGVVWVLTKVKFEAPAEKK
jgi:uncharacterized protein (TIGR03067 family)